MKYYRHIIFIIFIIPCLFSAQTKPGARQIALSNSGVALSNDVFSIFNNPAGAAQFNWQEVGIYYSPSPFGLKQLKNGYAAYHQSTSLGTFQIGIMTYGFKLYKENKFALSYSTRIFKRFFLGTTVMYQSLRIQNYGNTSAINIILGGIVYLSNNFRTGFTLENLLFSTYGKEKNQIPVVYNFGLSYDLLYNVTINTALRKEIDFPVSLRFGLEYSIIKYLTLRFGIHNEPNTYSAGLGINYSFFEIDYALFTHQDLGLTHQAGIIVHFGGDETRLVRMKKYLNF